MTPDAQQQRERFGSVLVVVDHQYAMPPPLARPGRRLSWQLGFMDQHTGQADREHTALAASLANRYHRAAMHGDQAPHQSESDAEAAVRLIHAGVTLREQIEDMWQHLA